MVLEAAGLHGGKIMADEMWKGKIECGALIEVPAYETHKRGRNWLAVIEEDPKAPGGLSRIFCERAKGKFFYMTDILEVGQAVECAGDYVSGGGNRSPNRVYGVVSKIDDTVLEVIVTKDASEACSLAAQMAAEPEEISGWDEIEVLRQKRADLIRQSDDVDEEIFYLRSWQEYRERCEEVG